MKHVIKKQSSQRTCVFMVIIKQNSNMVPPKSSLNHLCPNSKTLIPRFLVRADFIWTSKSNWYCTYRATRLVTTNRATFSSNQIRSKTKTDRNSLARVFPRFASAPSNNLEFWLVPWIICILCDWPERLLWFWFYDTQLKTALRQFIVRITRSQLPGASIFHTDPVSQPCPVSFYF